TLISFNLPIYARLIRCPLCIPTRRSSDLFFPVPFRPGLQPHCYSSLSLFSSSPPSCVVAQDPLTRLGAGFGPASADNIMQELFRHIKKPIHTNKSESTHSQTYLCI